MGYDPRLKRYVCKSCGLSLTTQELMEIKDKAKPASSDDEERRKRRKEYLDWWSGSKKR